MSVDLLLDLLSMFTDSTGQTLFVLTEKENGNSRDSKAFNLDKLLCTNISAITTSVYSYP